MTEKDLLNLKDEIREAKNRVAELKGQKTALMKQLKEEWGVTSIEKAEEKLANLKEEIAELEKQITEATEEIDKKYPV